MACDVSKERQPTEWEINPKWASEETRLSEVGKNGRDLCKWGHRTTSIRKRSQKNVDDQLQQNGSGC